MNLWMQIDLKIPPFFVVSLLFPFATYIFSLSFFIYSPFFHEYKSSPISERNLLIFNQIIIMYICLIRGKKYKVKPKNIMFCNIRYLGQHLLLPWGKSNFFFNQNLLQLPMYVPYFILLKFNKQKYIRKAVIYFVLLQISKCFFHTLLRHVSKEKWYETREKCFHNRNPFYFNLGGERGRTIHQVSISAKWTS